MATSSVATRSDVRFVAPILSARTAGVHLGIPETTIKEWIGKTGDEAEALMHSVPPETPHGPRLPFIALAEAQILRALRRAGLSMHEVRAGVHRLRQETGEEYVLARHDIAASGSHLLYNVAAGVAPEWVRARNGQVAIRQVVDMVRKFVYFADDGFARRLLLPRYGETQVIIDPDYAFGQPVLEQSKIRVDTIADLFYGGGESVGSIAAEFDLTEAEVETVLRVLARRVG